MIDRGAQYSPYGLVYAALSGALEAGMCNVAPGTESTVARALVHFRAMRDSRAVERLERISLTIVGLQQALREASAEDYRRRRRSLLRQTRAWIEQAPLVSA